MAGGDDDDVKLLGAHVSPFAMRTAIALCLKGVEYEFLPQNFDNKSEFLLQSNPIYKKVPVLIHNGKPICESMIIVEYIDETWPSTSHNAILPADYYDRSTARFWVTYIDNKWYPGIWGIILAQTEEAKTEAIEQLSAGLLLFEEVFEKCSKGKGYFGGDTIGYLDIALGCFLAWLAAAGKICNVEFLDVAKTPLLVGWAERFRSAKVVEGLIAETDELVEFVKFLQAKYSAAPVTK